jgi:hypothetical protein
MNRYFFMLGLLLACTVCGTVGGAISGAGSDVQKAGG